MSSTAQNKDSVNRSQLEIEQEEENRKIRRLQLMMNMVMSVLAQDEDITLEEASEMLAQDRMSSHTQHTHATIYAGARRLFRGGFTARL